MIQEFSIQNFLSFKEKQTISFVATADKTLVDELTWETRPGGVKLLRMTMIYGANASGKSNLLEAIQTLWQLMISSSDNVDLKIPAYRPFKLQNGKPTVFEIIFWANGRKFQYELQYDSSSILYEKLMYSSDKDVLSLLYERVKGETVRFGSTVEIKARQRDDLIKDTLKNHTLLGTLRKKNIEVPYFITELYSWVKSNVHELDIHNNGMDIAEQASDNPSLKKSIIELLNKADFNLTDFNVVEIPLEEDLIKVLSELKSLSEDALTKMKKQLLFTHHTNEGSFQISFTQESSGTKMYFRMARLLFDLKNSTCILMIDEIEDSLHYDLLIHFLQTYLQAGGQSQLIFTTHNQMLLDEDWMIRRDMVWFTEKKRETSSTTLYRASDMGIHKNASLMNAYRIGKLGAKPLLGSTYLNSEEA